VESAEILSWLKDMLQGIRNQIRSAIIPGRESEKKISPFYLAQRYWNVCVLHSVIRNTELKLTR
jgi:hypothetical protein